MSNTNTGGPAFPTQVASYEGMTLGQYDFTFFEDDEKAQPEDTLALCLARNSYTMADAMLKAREE